MTPRPMCGSCTRCLKITNHVCTPPREPGMKMIGQRPTARQLTRHGERFGWEGVPELAAELGLTVKLPKDAVMTLKKQQPVKVKQPTIKERIRLYLKDGKTVEYIAEIEKTNASRARRLVKEVQEEDA